MLIVLKGNYELKLRIKASQPNEINIIFYRFLQTVSAHVAAHIARWKQQNPTLQAWQARDMLLANSICDHASCPSLGTITQLLRHNDVAAMPWYPAIGSYDMDALYGRYAQIHQRVLPHITASHMSMNQGRYNVKGSGLEVKPALPPDVCVQRTENNERAIRHMNIRSTYLHLPHSYSNSAFTKHHSSIHEHIEHIKSKNTVTDKINDSIKTVDSRDQLESPNRQDDEPKPFTNFSIDSILQKDTDNKV